MLPSRRLCHTPEDCLMSGWLSWVRVRVVEGVSCENHTAPAVRSTPEIHPTRPVSPTPAVSPSAGVRPASPVHPASTARPPSSIRQTPVTRQLFALTLIFALISATLVLPRLASAALLPSEWAETELELARQWGLLSDLYGSASSSASASGGQVSRGSDGQVAPSSYTT